MRVRSADKYVLELRRRSARHTLSFDFGGWIARDSNRTNFVMYALVMSLPTPYKCLQCDHRDYAWN